MWSVTGEFPYVCTTEINGLRAQPMMHALLANVFLAPLDISYKVIGCFVSLPKYLRQIKTVGSPSQCVAFP